jgi:hypothetical protein
VAVVVGASIGWRLSGGSLFTIATPSMCPDLCVGTLVLDRPHPGPLAPGLVVTFRPPGTRTVYTHRVARVLPDGAVLTRGDAIGRADPWTVPRSRVIGVVVANVRGLGWLWRSVPWMAAVLAIALVVRRWVDPDRRPGIDTVGATLALALPTLLLRPFIRTAVVALRPRPAGGIVMRVVNTGLLALRYGITGAGVAGPVAPGHLVTVATTRSHGTAIALHAVASLPTLGWAAVIAIVLSPVLGLAVRLVTGAWRGRGRAQRRPRGGSGCGEVPTAGSSPLAARYGGRP